MGGFHFWNQGQILPGQDRNTVFVMTSLDSESGAVRPFQSRMPEPTWELNGYSSEASWTKR
jgi:hypothetical protein